MSSQNTIPRDEVITLKEACEILHCHPNTLRKWDNEGYLKAIRFGSRGDRRYRKEDVLKMLDWMTKEASKGESGSALFRTYLAHALTEKKSISDRAKLSSSIRAANIDLNPHQVDAAIFAFKSPLSRGAILADEVGLGKTIEAGLIIDQLIAEGRNKILILVPASLRTQWQDELRNRFYLENTTVIDGPTLKKIQKERMQANPLEDGGIFIASHNFAYRYDFICGSIPWDLVIIDEAHRLRNVWRKTNKTAKRIREVLKGRPKILLTATPLQNNLMELFGLTSFLDEDYMGTEYSFKTLFANPVKKQNKTERLLQLKERLMGTIDSATGEPSGGILTRTLRKQVKGLVPFTNRYSVTEDFEPNDREVELYDHVSEYLRRPYLASTKATQRNMMELVYRKILASSTFAIAGTLYRVSHFLSKRLQQEFGVEQDELNALAEQLRKEAAAQYHKELAQVSFPKYEKREEKEEEQEPLPGLDDTEQDLVELSEVSEDADDLGEDELLDDDTKKFVEREIDHKFTKEEVLAEFKDVLSYHFLASAIDQNQKSHALVRVLNKVFKHAEKQNWPQKAVIFTESRRTQDHLEKLLGGLGYDLVLFNGTNAGKRAREIFEEWQKAFPKEAEEGTKTINLRKALVWKFKTLEKGILITTEAGAEGLNLQFSNIVINYDLPWNPQRVEQRIGRCHRYGQKLDVLVINFLNRRNYADQRVYELLSEKIRLFGNLFDFSDKVLGTEQLTDDGYEVREIALGGLGSGVDFERKILDIYRKCRTEKEIENGFKQLQLELSPILQEKIEDAHRKVVQHFDEEVRRKLRFRQQEIEKSLSRYDSLLRKYIDLSLGDEITYIADNVFEHEGRTYYLGSLAEEEKRNGYKPATGKEAFVKNKLDVDKKTRGAWKVILRHSDQKARHYLEEFVGKECQLAFDILNCKRKTITNTDEEFERIILSGIYKDGDTWKPIDASRLEKIFTELEVEREEQADGRLRDELEDSATKRVNKEKEAITLENEQYIFEEMDRLNQFVEESLLKFQQEMDERRKEINDLKKTVRASRTLGHHERLQIQDQIGKKQQELFRSQKKYIKAQEDQMRGANVKEKDLRGKLQMEFERERIASVHFSIAA
jgi:SNF2 family DNA or RNA helicase